MKQLIEISCDVLYAAMVEHVESVMSATPGVVLSDGIIPILTCHHIMPASSLAHFTFWRHPDDASEQYLGEIQLRKRADALTEVSARMGLLDTVPISVDEIRRALPVAKLNALKTQRNSDQSIKEYVFYAVTERLLTVAISECSGPAGEVHKHRLLHPDIRKRREDVSRLFHEGLAGGEIAERVHRSESTIKRDLAKLNLRTRVKKTNLT